MTAAEGAPDVHLPQTGSQESNSLHSYLNADTQTRNLIEAQLGRNHWLAQQQTYLQWAGLILGFLTTLAFLGVSAWLINGGQAVSGTILGTIDLVALVTVFVLGRRSSA